MPAIKRLAGMARSCEDTVTFHHRGWRFAMPVNSLI